ncbi:MAG: hypothetical protein ACFFDW_11380 [Candidatus Thorarchaeota archaeon]
MDKMKFYKIIFFIEAGWNMLLSALIIILALTLKDPFFNLLGMDTPNNFVWFCLFWILVLIYGFCYMLVGLDLTKNHLVVSAGIIAKLAYFIAILIFFILGSCNWILFLTSIFSLVFAGFAIEFYVNYKKLVIKG